MTSVSDIAGQVTAKSANADHLTEATVYLPTGGLKAIQRRLPSEFPKWRDATDTEVAFILDLIDRECLAVSAGSIDKTTEQWAAFWIDAAATHSKVASVEGSSIGFLKAATLIKFLLFAHAGAAGLSQAILSGAVPRGRHGRIQIEEIVIIDNEIQGDDNREALVEVWRAINRHQPLSNALGLVRKARSLQLTTEQQEPLLLLADYVAGIVHATRSQANTLSKSRVTARAARSSFDRLQRSDRFKEFSAEIELRYFDIYPEFIDLVQAT